MKGRWFTIGVTTVLALAAAIGACVSDEGTNVFANNDAGTNDGDVSTLDGSAIATTDGSTATTDGGKDAGPSDAGIDATPVPLQLDKSGQIALWLEASSANFMLDGNGNIVQWTDLGQNKNHAACGGGTCPTFVPNAIAGHGAVEFTGGNAPFSIKDSMTLQFGTDHVAIFAVMKTLTGLALYTKDTCVNGLHTCGFQTGLQLAPSPFQVDGGDGGFLHDFSVNMVDDVNGQIFTYGAAVFDDDGFHIVGLRRYGSGTGMKLYVDERDASDNATSPTDISQAGQNITLGPVPNDLVHGGTVDVAELVVVHSSAGVIGDPVIDQLRAYLSQKYKL